MIRNLAMLAVLVAWCVTASPLMAAWPAHPYHLTRAEVAWNAQSGNFEVALCVWPVDLESALRQQEQRPVDLQREPKLDELTLSYIQSRFRLRPNPPADGEEQTELEPPAKIRWVGMEPGLKHTWLYFEIQGDPEVTDWTLENRVFFELNADQLNHVQWSLGKRFETFVCQLNEPRHPVSTDRILRTRETIRNGLRVPGGQVIGN